MNMSREGQAMCFLLVQILFLLRQIIDYPNPDVNDDMKMFEMLGLNPQNHLLKFLNQQQLKLQILNLLTLGEKPKWSSPGHTIEKTLKHQVKENNILSLKIPFRRMGFLWTTISSRILINHLLRN
jgi:biotin synthase